MTNARRAAPLSADDAARLHPSDRTGRITCRASGTTATMLLYGEIGWEVTAAGVTQALASASKADTLDIRISSIGGSVPDGWAIYNAITRHPATTKKVTVEGIAASMASIIAMAGTEIVIPENSYMMIHNPSGLCMGNATDMRSMADLIDHMQSVAVQTYADRSGQQPATVQALMDAETYMPADLAVSLGFADRVEKPVAMTAKLDLSKLPTLPAQMRAALSKETRMADTTNPKPQDLPAAAPSVTPKDQPAPAGHPYPGQEIGTGAPQTDAPAHVEDGQPGALPVDAPDTRRQNPPASPGYLPADPVQVAEACAHAGFATMTARLLRGRFSMADVTHQISMAGEIAEAGKLTGQSALAVAAIEEGLSIDAFRKMAFAAKAGNEPAIFTAVPASKPAAPTEAASIDTTDVYTRMRAQQAASRTARAH